MEYKPYEYQDHATQHIIKNFGAGLFLEMGLGKTVSTLTALNLLMFEYFEVSKPLVIAPKRVAENTWTTECQKWDHLKHLKISLILGNERQRKEALKEKADIYVINRENVVWLVSLFASAFPFDAIVIDELSSFKSAKSARFKALRQIRPKINRVIGLTGTPSPNGLLDLWSQLYLLDMGERLGKTLTNYRDRYFTPSKRSGHIVYKYGLRKEDENILGEGIYEKEIYEKIGDICISMAAKDYLTLPERVEISTPVTLSPAAMKLYLDFEREQVIALIDSETEITAVNAAALTNKLLQFANGAVYDEFKGYHVVHNEKIEALEERIEAANGNPVLVFYSYKHDLERIMHYFKAYKPVQLKSSADIDNWNAGKIQLFLAHPASAGHGLNLQAGGHHIIWFSLPWSLELYEQGNARIDRQGQIKPPIIDKLLTSGTMDEDVLNALTNKAVGQNALMQAVKAKIAKYS